VSDWPEELPHGLTWSDFQHPVMSRMSSGKEMVGSLLRSIAEGAIIVPSYQRPKVWTPKQQAAFAGFVLEGAPLPAIYVREIDVPGKGIEDELVDGQQRLDALAAFTAGEVPAVFPSTGKCAWIHQIEWTGWRMRGMPVCRFRGTEAEALSLYLAINSAGTPHTQEELERVRARLNEAASERREDT
jgi:hypothetical protein